MVKPKLFMESAVRIHAINVRSAAIKVRSTARSVRISAISVDDFPANDSASASNHLENALLTPPIRVDLTAGFSGCAAASVVDFVSGVVT
jgi:hypothetical protein